MVDMTASGWYPSNVQVIKSWRPWGPKGQRQSLVQMTINATNFGGGAHLIPGEGIPAPLPTLVGFRESIDYIIPVSPFIHTTRAPGHAASGWSLQWGCLPPTYGVSGGTVSTGPRLTVQLAMIRVSGTVSAANGVTQPILYAGGSVVAATDNFTTDTMRAYGIFVGK